jgi:hypothetical protein
VKQDTAAMTRTSRTMALRTLLLAGFAAFALASSASAQGVAREQDINNLRLGQRVRVDDGSCPPGQVKEVTGTKLTAAGVERARKCVPRLGIKKK